MKKLTQIFLSYARADKIFAGRLAKELKRAGVEPFFDIQDIKAGDDWGSVIKKQLASSDLFVFVVPSLEGEGRLALMEVGAARALNKDILAVLPDKARISNTSFLRSFTDRPMLDATNLSPSVIADRIVSSVSAH